MSKNHRESRKPASADWIIRHTASAKPATITCSTFTRDQHGGYTFTDSKGITADFPPGTVLSITRKDPEPAVGPLAERLESLDSRA